MRRPSAGWYVLAALLVAAPVMWSGFDFGSRVRGTLDAIVGIQTGHSEVVELESGQVRTLFQQVESTALTADRQDCAIEAVDGQQLRVDDVDTEVTITLFESEWVAQERIFALETGRIGISCMNGAAALGPDIGDNGLGIVNTFAGWTARSLLFTLPGLFLGASLAIVVARRRSRVF